MTPKTRSMTLFAEVAPCQLVFKKVLEKFFDGKMDEISVSCKDYGRTSEPS